MRRERLCGPYPDGPASARSEGKCGTATGTLKRFNAQKGFGSSQPEGGGQDVFVHITAVQAAGLGKVRRPALRGR